MDGSRRLLFLFISLARNLFAFNDFVDRLRERRFDVVYFCFRPSLSLSAKWIDRATNGAIGLLSCCQCSAQTLLTFTRRRALIALKMVNCRRMNGSQVQGWWKSWKWNKIASISHCSQKESTRAAMSHGTGMRLSDALTVVRTQCGATKFLSKGQSVKSHFCRTFQSSLKKRQLKRNRDSKTTRAENARNSRQKQSKVNC